MVPLAAVKLQIHQHQGDAVSGDDDTPAAVRFLGSVVLCCSVCEGGGGSGWEGGGGEGGREEEATTPDRPRFH